MALRDTFLRNVEAALGMFDTARQEAAMRKQARQQAAKIRQTRAEVGSRTPPPSPYKSREEENEEAKRRLAEMEQEKLNKMRDAGVTPSEDMEPLPSQGPMSTGEDFGEGLDPDALIADVENDPAVLGGQAIQSRRDTATAQRVFNAPSLQDPDFGGFEAPKLPSSMQSLEEYEAGQEEITEPKSLASLKSKQAPQPPKAIPVEPDEGRMGEYFRVATGTQFDPNSSRDRSYMEKIKTALRENPDLAKLSPRQFAVKLYAMG